MIKRMNKTTINLTEQGRYVLYKLPKGSEYLKFHYDRKGNFKGFTVKYVTKRIPVDMEVTI